MTARSLAFSLQIQDHFFLPLRAFRFEGTIVHRGLPEGPSPFGRCLRHDKRANQILIMYRALDFPAVLGLPLSENIPHSPTRSD